jgi:hypothetical protein
LARGPGLSRDHTRINANFPLGSPAPSGFFDQGIFDEADHRRDDSPSDAAARQLPGQHTNIEAAGAARRAAQARLIFFSRPPAAFPPTAPAISWIMKLTIVPDIFVSRLDPPGRTMPAPERRGLVSKSNQMTGNEHFRSTRFVRKMAPVSPENLMRCNHMIKLDGCRPPLLCRMTNGGGGSLVAPREVKVQACRPHRRLAVFIFVLFRGPPCTFRVCNDI